VEGIMEKASNEIIKVANLEHTGSIAKKVVANLEH
jgi:hypothetical protein